MIPSESSSDSLGIKKNNNAAPGPRDFLWVPELGQEKVGLFFAPRSPPVAAPRAASRAAIACARARLAAACDRSRDSIMPWLPTQQPGLTAWVAFDPDALREAARAWRHLIAATRIYLAVRLWWRRLRDGPATSHPSPCPPHAALRATPQCFPADRQPPQINASSRGLDMTELLAHNARASQASLHGQLEGHGWGGNGRLRRPGKGHAKGPRRDEVVTDINSILRLCGLGSCIRPRIRAAMARPRAQPVAPWRRSRCCSHARS